MDTTTLVNDELDAGGALVEALRGAGLEVAVAFWAKIRDASSWNLYLASPAVGTKEGTLNAYRKLQTTLSQRTDLGVDIFDVLLVNVDNSMAVAAAEILTPRVATGPFAVTNPKPYSGMTRYGGSRLGGMEIDGAYIYPPPRESVTA